ncbi:MAG TPA: hypothetical protein VGC76_17045 [Pyrinomonadaceae bacterium]|jgi:hypothetical protein
MELIFAENIHRHQCSSEVLINGFRARCRFSTSRVVTIPTGLHYFDGRLNFNQTKPSSTISICKNHEMRLKIALRELLEKN